MMSERRLAGIRARKTIYNLVESNPGLHHRDISRKTGIPKSTTKYHLDQLCKQGLLSIKVEKKFRRYYTILKTGVEDKKLISLLRQEVPFRMFLYFLIAVSCSQIELSKALEIQPATVNYHLKKMKEIGMIEDAPVVNGYIPILKRSKMKREPIGREKFYRRIHNETCQQAYRLIISNRHSFYEEELFDDFFDVIHNSKLAKEHPSYDEQFLNVINAFEDLMKPPFCA